VKYKISIITVCYNSLSTLKQTVNSVFDQTYDNIEYIIIDGDSVDGTLEYLKSISYHNLKWISEPDRGIYDAMNKGIKIATGDIVGIINSDDYFTSNTVIESISRLFSQNLHLDSVIGDVLYVKSNIPNKVIRHYSSKSFKPYHFRFGIMPPHASFYVKRKYFSELGYYKINYRIAADFELLLRFFFVNGISYKYLKINMVTMRMGGVSTRGLKSIYTLNSEILKACRDNNVYSNIMMIYSKYILKVFQFLWIK
jgi:glycosyltransferase involved in cell wall biosynthesis